MADPDRLSFRVSGELIQAHIRIAYRWDHGLSAYGAFVEMCSGSKAGLYLRLIDFVYHSTRSLRGIKKKKRKGYSLNSFVVRGVAWCFVNFCFACSLLHHTMVKSIIYKCGVAGVALVCGLCSGLGVHDRLRAQPSHRLLRQGRPPF